MHFSSPALSRYCRSFLRKLEPFCFKLLQQDSTYMLTWPTPSLHPQRIEEEARNALQAFQDDQLMSSYKGLNTSDSACESNVLVFPVIQAGQLGIREEERTMHLLFRHLNQYSRSTSGKVLLDFTSGYFSLSEAYQKLVQVSNVDCRILCASPEVRPCSSTELIYWLMASAGEWILRLKRHLWTDPRRLHIP